MLLKLIIVKKVTTMHKAYKKPKGKIDLKNIEKTVKEKYLQFFHFDKNEH